MNEKDLKTKEIHSHVKADLIFWYILITSILPVYVGNYPYAAIHEQSTINHTLSGSVAILSSSAAKEESIVHTRNQKPQSRKPRVRQGTL